MMKQYISLEIDSSYWSICKWNVWIVHLHHWWSAVLIRDGKAAWSSRGILQRWGDFSRWCDWNEAEGSELSYPHFGPKNTHSNFFSIFW